MVRKQQTGEMDVMDRRESSLWLGRALSTHEVTLRALLQLIEMANRQQKLIGVLYQEVQRLTGDAEQAMRLRQSEEKFGPELVEQLDRLGEQISPLVKMVDQSCAQLEKMLE
jgi:hypothetical protein